MSEEIWKRKYEVKAIRITLPNEDDTWHGDDGSEYQEGKEK